MIKKRNCNPIRIVGMEPLYTDDTQKTLKGWIVCVDFLGKDVPDIKVLGGRLRETDPAESFPERYSHGYSFVTRAEYFFKNSLVHNGYKNMCRFKKRIRSRMDEIQNMQQKDISPIFVSDVPVYTKDGYKVSVGYDGNLEDYFPKIARNFEYNPFGAKIIKCVHNRTENITCVDYLFRPGVANKGETRAWDFMDKVRMQIDLMKLSENIKSNS